MLPLIASNDAFKSLIETHVDEWGNVISSAGVKEFFILVFSAVAMGLAMSILYRRVTGKGIALSSQNLAITLVILPPVIAAVVFLVGNNLAAAFSLAGVFSITRFRSAAANSKDLTFIFVSMAIGLSCGTGFVLYGAAITIILSVVLLVLSELSYGENKTTPKILRINVPESLSFTGMFDPILQKYAVSWDIARMRTVDLGATYEISFKIMTKENIDEKAFIDELRCLNGNMNIILMLDKRGDGRGEM
ncbi:MAG: DUF4956 domain-containing protein [Oscillospiraceae bacterium]|nr:DUF4956 domain-containing protein [Oscillospiraceae bacterium]